ncbi:MULTISPECIES: hypothetical protein [unclassified Leptolyngbya]|uniref:hypothetical protein n=1 Tax=unclassified Leptolyngbya TaxID=2650499 RepID=UPI0016864946|nr:MULTISPECIES: hypothetical protein [unclassified Leptolyngbya]MBD1911964.1 hypothetical protein [Leptolyngbya sp. FACHB-8]MBD2157100.1 hypothetical protein [Leptolyngbya sp. FACHB-16]
MTEPGNSSESQNTGLKGFKVTLMQGIIGAITLAATTAIPLLVQRALSPQPPVVPAQVVPTTTAPANTSVQSSPTSTEQPSVEPSERNSDRKGRKKKKD